MKKQKKKRKQKFQKRNTTSATPPQKGVKQSSFVPSPLDILAEKRKGGAESIKGFIFQCRYTVWKILTHLGPPETSEEKFLRLEGLEDIDIIKVTADGNSYELIQVKSSKNKMDAGKFWGEHRILQNFAEVYLNDPKSRFRIVHDMGFSEGYLSRLDQARKDRRPLSGKDLEHWKNKFSDLQKQQEKDDKKDFWNWTAFNLSEFLERISFEKTSDSELSEKIHLRLIENFDILEGNEKQYTHALCWHVLLWSKDKAVIRQEDIVNVIENVREDIAKGPVNPALQNRWLSCVSFETSEKESNYFEGKPARPQDIAADLPARRPKWEREFLDTFKESDVTVIRASSGQGKSTLAWQVALLLSMQGWRPYEMHWCADAKETGSILTFIESRIAIGEMPLIVIDGLREAVSGWDELARRTENLPVKYIVTAREEDWYRFGTDRSRLRLIPVSIEMNRDEAGDIHAQFKKVGKLQSTGLKWQTAWEQVQKRGLLIEYVYLLTHGAMMEERLSHQIRAIAKERNAAEKLEILRLVSVADLCGVRLPSSLLIESVNERIGFQSDRGETLKSLEREYQILIENLDYAEGLHPVRSRHLADILHESLPMVNSLINILTVIESDSLHEFSAHAPLLIEGKHRIRFLERLAEHVAERSYAEMVRVIDGLFSTDAKQNWEVNRKIYNDLSSRGVANEIVILNAFPWGGVNTIKVLAKNDKPLESLGVLQDTIDRMIKFEPETSDTFTFIKNLSNHLTLRDQPDDLKTFGRLAKWFSRFDLPFPLLEADNEPVLWQAVNTLDLEDAGELFDAYYSANPERYNAFLGRNTGRIIGLLKRRTNTLTIVEKNDNLQIEYLIEHDSEILNLNDESVKRAQVISLFLPHYNEYHVNALYPPIHGLDVLDVFTNSHDEKRMPKENIGNKFRVHVNRIWIDRIMANYECASVYEWQKQWFDIRKKSLELATLCIRYLESLLEGKSGRLDKVAGAINRLRPIIIKFITTKKEFPKKGENIFNTAELANAIDGFSKWIFPWKYYIRQMQSLLEEDEHGKHLVNINIQETRRNLGKMQNAYKIISENTFPYFDTEELEETETAEYNRLAKTVAFYLSNLNYEKISNVKFAVTDWMEKQERIRINGIIKVLSELEEDSDFRFIPPRRTVEKSNLLGTAIGVKGMELKRFEEQNLDELIFGLMGLADLDIDFFHLIPIEGTCTESKNAFWISRDFFVKLKMGIESDEESIDFGISKPCPVAIDKELLDVLPGITMEKEHEENAIKTSLSNILMLLWRLSEIRKRLSKEEKNEYSWRQELEQGCEDHLNDQMRIIEKEASEDISSKYRKLIEDATQNDKRFTSEDIQRYFLDVL